MPDKLKLCQQQLVKMLIAKATAKDPEIYVTFFVM